MGSPRDDDTHFQNVDDLISPHTVSGHEVKDPDIMGTMPFDDTVFWDDYDDGNTVLSYGNAHEAQMETQAMDLVGDTQLVDFDVETQVVDFDGETQAVDFDEETQALDFDEETQALDFEGEILQLDDIDCNENIGTQVLSDNDDALSNDGGCEESESTQTLGDNDYILDDEALQGIDQLVDQERVHYTSHCELDEKNVMQVQDALMNEKRHSEPHIPASSPAIQGPSVSESGPLRFTLIRAAALRASGLAVQNMNKEKKVHAGSSILTQNHALESVSVAADGAHFKEDSSKHDSDEKHDRGICHENGSRLRHENKLKAGNSTARKLFAENTCSNELGTLHNERNTRKINLLEVPSFECQVSGLSYVNSQEPGELSQTYALDFVDRFIQTSIKECDLDITHGKDTLEKEKSVSKRNGLQSLVKNVKDKSTVEKSEVFDWDDSREDEGGGEICCRIKEDLFNRGVVQVSCTLPVPWKLSGGISNGYRNRGHSDSKLELCALKPSKKYSQLSKGKTRKNLITEFDEELKIKECKAGLVNNITEKDGEQFSNVGFDTQVAAEAMETLCQGEEIDFPIGDAHHCLPNASKDSLMGSVRKATVSLNSKHNTPCKRISTADVEFDLVEPKKRKISGKLQEKLAKSRRSNKTTNQSVQEGIHKFVPIARRTRRSLIVNQMEDAENAWGDDEPITHGTSKNRISTADVEFDSVEPKKRKISGKLQEELAKPRRSNKTTNQSVQEGIHKFVPIARRTRRSLIVNQMEDAENAWGDDERITHGTSKYRIGKTKKISKGHAKVHKSKSTPNHSKELKNVKLSRQRQPNQKSRSKSDGNLLGKFISPDSNAVTRPRTRRSSVITHNDHSKLNMTPPVQYAFPVFSSLDKELQGNRQLGVKGSENAISCCTSDTNGKLMIKDFIERNEVRSWDGKSDVGLMSSAQNPNCKDSPEKKCKPSNALSATPDNCKTPVNAASPVCMGDDYYNKYFKKNLSKPRMIQEIRSLSAMGHLLSSTPNISRKRRDTTGIRVLYSHHLSDDIVNQQKKILSRLGISMALSITDATHFIADKFVRTRNMLEAIALSKSVVTHSWIENCGQANCFIDEKNHILRDTKKEKEFGFCMPLSLSRAAKHPLLKGQRILITENTKPGKEIISSLVKAVEGQAVERIGRTALKNDKIAEDLLVLSCEEDYEICVPFLEKGAAVYSSELLLNGIVIQKLEFERHRLFADHVKRTRSTMWLKKDGNKFLPVAKSQ